MDKIAVVAGRAEAILADVPRPGLHLLALASPEPVRREQAPGRAAAGGLAAHPAVPSLRHRAVQVGGDTNPARFSMLV